jgi:allantoin racemase
VATEGCDAIMLGCAGMADLAAELTARVGVPVVDGVAAAVAALEGRVRLGLTTGKRGEFAPPPPKTYTGAPARFGNAPRVNGAHGLPVPAQPGAAATT